MLSHGIVVFVVVRYRHNFVNAKIIKIQNVCVCLGLSRNLFLFLSRNTVRNSFLYFSTDPTKCTLYRVRIGKLVQDDTTVHLLLSYHAASGVAFYDMLSLIESSNKVSCDTEHVLNTGHVVNAIKIIVIIYSIGGNSIKRGTFWLWCKNESWFSHSLWGPVKTDYGAVGWSSNSLYI